MVFSNIPPELESEILSRIPPTSVKQLQLTCKRWYALFKDPRFIKKHVGKAARQMVLKKDESVYSFSFNVQGIHNRYDQFIEFTGKLTSLKDSQDVIVEIFHCEGLLLCTTNDNRLVVWNPCTGQTWWVQPRPSSKKLHTRNKYFLGYENNNKLSDNYKILCFGQNFRNDQTSRPEIYEFNSDSWRVPHAVTDDWKICWDVAVSLKGNTYWLYYWLYSADEHRLDSFILRFDFTAERLERLPLTFQIDDEYDADNVVLSSVREEKLAVLYQAFDRPSVMKIWVTNTKIDEAKDLSWSVFLVVDFDRLMVDTSMTRVTSFLVDEENKKVMYCDTDDDDEERTRLHIVGEDIHKIVYREVPKGSRISPFLVSYVPSLVQIPARQSNPCGKRKR